MNKPLAYETERERQLKTGPNGDVTLFIFGLSSPAAPRRPIRRQLSRRSRARIKSPSIKPLLSYNTIKAQFVQCHL